MPPANSCPRCGRPAAPGVSFCASCGSNLSSTSGGKGWKLLLGAVALFGGLLWASALYTQPRPSAQPSQPQGLVGSGQGVAQTAQPTPSPSLTLTSARHLAEAKRALADGYKPNKDPQKAQWGEVTVARWHLKAIGATAPEYREAQELLKEVGRREKQAELGRKKAEAAEDVGETADAADDGSDDDSPAASSSTPSSASSASTARKSPPAGGSSSDYYTNSRGIQVQRPTFSENGPPPGASAQCGDGSYSFSQSRRGTCSHHGGVSRWL